MGDKAKLLFTDTDSLCYEIETGDVYEDIKNDVDKWYDTSNYDKDHPSGLYSGKNKKVIGYFKDECGGKFITEFVGLKPSLTLSKRRMENTWSPNTSLTKIIKNVYLLKSHS